ncbi:efflux RND transporter periplasmic adaptor subunit [Hyphomicrobium sp. LHD-15]|uniref:efflux RND transporter periplasmic adaptor subunit n=1 Tax=Hyphomicrobium sp. LHD-15 TaxID=3072142 RepID=UPI00280D30B9|nr:efflux RND transporter periplasmic adaptor subunit [Hyphomicrobium sp. LHD-15]MDQ8700870.1 efflux RND transporter periplasmic adaptor subunit [Hyphomicrobium sp. LHD-15]
MLVFMRVGSPLSIALALILTSTTAALSEEREYERRPQLTVTVDSVRTSRIEDIVVGTGTVAAWREMPISSEANALAIVELLADEGDEVKKGQLLARLNQTLLLAQIEQNNAAVAEAEASLSNALADQKRAHTVTSGVMSQQTIDQRELVVKTAAAKLASTQAALEETKARLAQTVIVAPANAIVAVRTATLGQVVQSGTDLFRLIQDGRIEVNALVPEADIFRILPKQTARIIDPMGRISRASVRIVAPMVDAKTRLGTARIALSAGTELKPGMFVRVEIDAGSTEALTVPLKAIVWRDGRAAVFTVSEDGTANLKTITAGRKTSSAVEVVDGLDAGERIVVEGAGLLNDGEKVRAEVASAQPFTATP